MISLDRLLDGLDISVDPVVLYDLRQPRALDRSRASEATIHFPISGGGVLELAGGATLRLTKDGLTVLPPRSRRNGNGDAKARRAGLAEKDIMVATGRLRATYLGSVGLFDQLREPLVEDLRVADPIRRTFRDLLAEIASQRPGRRAMIESLLRQCLILFLRRCCKRERRVPWMVALDDEGIGRAVAAMRDRPEHSFTLQGLAEVAGMSRSVFAARFAESVERSPMEFLKDVRLARAAELLTRTDLPVKTVAARVGYSSRSSFTRAFLGSHHIGPTAFRAEGRDPSPAEVRP
jgi:AraC-like DNA-binding protein